MGNAWSNRYVCVDFYLEKMTFVCQSSFKVSVCSWVFGLSGRLMSEIYTGLMIHMRLEENDPAQFLWDEVVVVGTACILLCWLLDFAASDRKHRVWEKIYSEDLLFRLSHWLWSVLLEKYFFIWWGQEEIPGCH